MTRIVDQASITAVKAQTDAYMSTLVAIEDTYTDSECIAPSEMKVGDHMIQHGCVYQVDEINTYQHEATSWRPADDVPVYVAVGTYVSGDLDMYRWFQATIQNGCAKDYRTSQQGNERATWIRAIY